ncbi:hypothetical protein V6N12_062633 [Hibiscus sabdariffa]|uniref:Uncharacterized protein n=1 Tax=Hibiscus sabdariffa TaxID=183260 RepID=A0ABR2F9G5_9ROSI
MEGLWRKLLGNQSHHDCFGCGNKVMETLPVYVKDDFFDSFCCDSLAGGSRNGRTRISEQMTRDRGIESKEGLFEIVDEWWQNPSNCLIGSVKFNVEAGVQWMGVGCGGHCGVRGGHGPFHGGRAHGFYYGRGYGYGGRGRGILHGKPCQLASCWNRVQLVDQTIPRD